MELLKRGASEKIRVNLYRRTPLFFFCLFPGTKQRPPNTPEFTVVRYVFPLAVAESGLATFNRQYGELFLLGRFHGLGSFLCTRGNRPQETQPNGLGYFSSEKQSTRSPNRTGWGNFHLGNRARETPTGLVPTRFFADAFICGTDALRWYVV